MSQVHLSPAHVLVFADHFNGKRVARRTIADGSIRYIVNDHLNSATVITDNTGGGGSQTLPSGTTVTCGNSSLPPSGIGGNDGEINHGATCTTGSNGLGYSLASMSIYITTATGTSSHFQLGLHDGDGAGNTPKTLLCNMTASATNNGRQWYTIPASSFTSSP